MSRHDRIISDLVNALDTIRREAQAKEREFKGRFGETDGFAYIDGVAGQAINNCRAQQVRNTDGYLVVKADEATPSNAKTLRRTA
jgi:hypothetical protein